MFSQTTHATLLARVADGSDPGAWHEFCERYAELIRAFARRRGLQPSDCDDAVQECLLALTKSLPGFTYDPAIGKFRAYLKTVVLHTIFRISRQKRGEAQLENVEEIIQAAAAGEDAAGRHLPAAGRHLPAASRNAADPALEEAWDEEWRQHHLRCAMRIIAAEFGEADRAAFQAYAVEGRDARAVAEALGLSVDQVYQAKSRIMKRLSQLIEEQVAEEG